MSNFSNGQGSDCNWSITGSFSGFGNLEQKSQKHDIKAKKKLMTAANGQTVGYKYYDNYEETSISGWFRGATGNTGTVAPLTASIGATVTVSNANWGSYNGNWSLDGFSINGQVEEWVSADIQMSRYVATPVV